MCNHTVRTIRGLLLGFLVLLLSCPMYATAPNVVVAKLTSPELARIEPFASFFFHAPRLPSHFPRNDCSPSIPIYFAVWCWFLQVHIPLSPAWRWFSCFRQRTGLHRYNSATPLPDLRHDRPIRVTFNPFQSLVTLF